MLSPKKPLVRQIRTQTTTLLHRRLSQSSPAICLTARFARLLSRPTRLLRHVASDLFINTRSLYKVFLPRPFPTAFFHTRICIAVERVVVRGSAALIAFVQRQGEPKGVSSSTDDYGGKLAKPSHIIPPSPSTLKHSAPSRGPSKRKPLAVGRDRFYRLSTAPKPRTHTHARAHSIHGIPRGASSRASATAGDNSKMEFAHSSTSLPHQR